MRRIKRWYENQKKVDRDMVWTTVYIILFILSIPLAYLLWRLYDLWQYCKYYPCEYLTFFVF